MIFRTGIDIIEIRRIADLIESSGDRFLSRHFTDGEIRYCRTKSVSTRHFAGRLAAKEAVYKALRMSWIKGFSWKHIEIICMEPGVPQAAMTGSVLAHWDKSGFTHIEISISHTRDFAAATAIIWGEG